MQGGEDRSHRTTNSYHLSPRELEELYRKYGRPGEIAPGRPATKKRSRLDAALAAMDRREGKGFLSVGEDNEDAGGDYS